MATSEAQAPPAKEAPGFTPLPIAGLQFRLIAFILDCIVVASIAMMFFAIGGGQAVLRYEDPPDSAIYLMVYITLAAIPFVPLFFAFLWAWRSQSLGMMAVGTIVTTREGYRISSLRAFLRSIFWLLGMLPLGAGAIPMFFDRERRALWDRMAGTVVRELR
jgi:uncharacterized RDD family membrane protein YckC